MLLLVLFGSAAQVPEGEVEQPQAPQAVLLLSVEIVIAVHAASIPFGCPHSFGQVPDGGLEQPQASEAVLPDTRVFLCR